MHLTAVLAKILFEQVPPARQLRPEVPAALDQLLTRMLDKEPAQRPADASALLSALEQLTLSAQASSPSLVPVRETLTAGEQRLVTLIVAMRHGGGEPDGLAGGADTDEDAVLAARFGELRSALVELGAQVERLADQTVVAAFTQSPGGEATDHAEQAVRGALFIKSLWPRASVVVATALVGNCPSLSRSSSSSLRLLAKLP